MDAEAYSTMTERARWKEELRQVLKDVHEPDRSWYRVLYVKYKILPAEYDAFMVSQNGVCAICKRPNPSGNRLVVDHNHQTGKVRGLLCHNCNVGIGNFHESPPIFHSALKYLGAEQ